MRALLQVHRQWQQRWGRFLCNGAGAGPFSVIESGDGWLSSGCESLPCKRGCVLKLAPWLHPRGARLLWCCCQVLEQLAPCVEVACTV